MRKTKEQRGVINRGIVVAIIIVAIVITVISIILVNRNKTNDTEDKKLTPNVIHNKTKPTIEGNEFVKEENGLKTNTSEKLKENKTYKNYTFTNIRIQTDAKGSVILADVKTSATQKQEGKEITIKFLDKEGKEIAKIGAYIGQMKPNETITFRTETTTDITNIYDFVIE